MNKKLTKIASLFLAVVLTATTVSAAEIVDTGEKSYVTVEQTKKDKISPELAEMIANADEDTPIPIYIFRELIPNEKISKMLLDETGMDMDVYEDSELFEDIVVSAVTESVEAQVGTERAHRIDPETEQSLIDVEVAKEAEHFLEEKRSIVKREYTDSNQAFADEYISDSQQLLYEGEYTPTLAIEATVSEIKAYAELDDVESIAFYEELICEPDLDTVLTQVGADSSTGTKSTSYNSGAGYKGSGIKIGIIEAGSGRYDASSPHLTGLSSTQLSYVANPKADGTYVTPTVTTHATKVTAIIVGKAVTISGKTYEGVVPLATVYQTGASTTTDVYTGFQALVNKGVNVINYSGGSTTTGYHAADKEIDRLISTTNVTFVKSAGNSSGEITSPGKALNAITVGNAQTKTSSTAAASAPYALSATSSYTEASYLPNKPDISAPGSYITTAASTSSTTTGSGTSYAAPIVTGILAQSMQRISSLKTNPYSAKAYLLLCADSSKMSTSGNAIAGNSYLREKSGAGLVAAKNILLGSTSRTATFTATGTSNSGTYSYTAGQKLRVVLVFGKKNTLSITSSSNMDDVDLKLINSATGSTVASSVSTRNNVEIIEYTIPSNGTYYFQAQCYRIQNTTNGIPYAMYWRVIS